MWPLQDEISLLGLVPTIQHAAQPPGLMRERKWNLLKWWIEFTISLAFGCSPMHSDIAGWLL